jgi:hypothetical protein
MRHEMSAERRRFFVALIAVAMIAAACTSGETSFAPNRRTSTPATKASASSPPLVQEGGAPLGPGIYTTVFQPKITFTTDASWLAAADTSDFVWLDTPGGSGGMGFRRIDRVLDPTRVNRMPVPKDYVGWIVTLPGVKVLAGPKALTVDGVAATAIDVTATKDAPTLYCKDPCVALWPLGRHADFQGEVAALQPGRVSRIVAIRVHGETLEISCGAPVANFEALAKDFDAVLQTIRLG